MSATWEQRKTRLRSLLKVSGGEDEEGFALDKFLEANSRSGSGELDEIRRCRIKDQDFSCMGALANGQFGCVELVKCRLDGGVYARKRIAKRAALRTRDQCSPQIERDVLVRAIESRTSWVPHILCAYHDQIHLNIVMNYAPGGSLWDVVESSSDDGRLSQEDLAWWIPQCVSAIDWCHSQGFVHRDIKPHNFVISETSHIQLIDFGSAAPLLPAREDGVRLIPKQYCLLPCGTCDYIAPEILKAHEEALVEMEITMHSGSAGGLDSEDESRVLQKGPKEGYGCEVDWWSFGAMVYELVYGVAPFFADDIRQTYFKIVEHRNSLHFKHATSISWELLSLIKGCLCQPENRLGRYSFDDIKGHAYFDDIQWEALPSLRHPKSLLLPQFTYHPQNTQQLTIDVSRISDDSHSKPFAFSALFQSSPGLSVLHATPARLGSRSPHTNTEQDLSPNFVGFSWGPRLKAFEKGANANTSVHRTMPFLSPALQTPLAPPNQFVTPARTGILKEPITSVRRITTSAGRTPRPVRPVSEREAFKQLVDCVGMSARKRVLESGRKPRLLHSSYEQSVLSYKPSKRSNSLKKELRFADISDSRSSPMPDMIHDDTSISSEDTDVPFSPSPSPRPSSAMSMVAMQQRSRSVTPTISGSLLLRHDSASDQIERSTASLRTGDTTSLRVNTPTVRGSNDILADLERRHTKLLSEIGQLQEEFSHAFSRLGIPNKTSDSTRNTPR